MSDNNLTLYDKTVPNPNILAELFANSICKRKFQTTFKSNMMCNHKELEQVFANLNVHILKEYSNMRFLFKSSCEVLDHFIYFFSIFKTRLIKSLESQKFSINQSMTVTA